MWQLPPSLADKTAAGASLRYGTPKLFMVRRCRAQGAVVASEAATNKAGGLLLFLVNPWPSLYPVVHTDWN